MPQEFQVVLHVKEADRAGAEEWLQRLLAILKENSPYLVSASTGLGTWCGGHVIDTPPTPGLLGPRQ